MRLPAKGTAIIGAGSGMGCAMATCSAAEGVRVVAGNRNAAQLDAAVAGSRASGGIVGAPADIVVLALVLASDEGRYVNAQIVPCDAGWTAT